MSWFADWFDSPYYHLLYRDRNEDEARVFIENLVKKVKIPAGAKVMDLACGKGRHSRQLNALGFDVLGLDLSDESILEAKQTESENLHFDVHDMREVYKEGNFDYVLNLFTSFGYFEEHVDTARTINSIHEILKPDGYLIIDFFNAWKVERELVEEEVKTVDDISFNIKRRVEFDKIVKDIHFEDEDVSYNFQERVQSLSLDEFKIFFEGRFKVQELYGDYELNDFDEDESPRLIILAQKVTVE